MDKPKVGFTHPVLQKAREIVMDEPEKAAQLTDELVLATRDGDGVGRMWFSHETQTQLVALAITYDRGDT